MNVLWIEDFGGGLPADSATLVNMFRGLLAANCFDDEWDPEADLPSRPELLEQFFLDHSPQHRVTLLRHFSDFRQKPTVVARSFDVVALDINLSRGIPPETPLPSGFDDAQAFHRKAGFYIYNELVRQGFPAENICFLTGERESTFSEFSEHCRHALIPLPEAFGKDDAGLESFRAWLGEREKSPYIRLRRGVIEACMSAREMLSRAPEALQFTLFLESGTMGETSIGDLLATLETFLPAKAPSGNDLERTLRLFVRAFAHEWESDARPQNVPRDGAARLPYVLRAYGWVMKHARNWLAHGDVLNAMTVEMAAFLFLVNMRAMFCFAPEIQRHEHLLLGIYPAASSLGESVVKEKLRESFSRLAEIHAQNDGELGASYNTYRDIANKVESLGVRSVDFSRVLFAMLFHELAQRRPREGMSPLSYECDARERNFRLSSDRDDFLYGLLRRVFSQTFK